MAYATTTSRPTPFYVRNTYRTKRGHNVQSTGVRGSEQEARGVFNAHVAYARTHDSLVGVVLVDASDTVLAEWRADGKVAAA